MGFTTILAYGAALVLSLCLAAWLTPRSWWRRPNVRALAVLGGGTLVFGTLFSAFLPPQASTTVAQAQAESKAAPGQLPVAGQRYRAWDNLNLRAGVGVGAPRLAVLPPGTLVAASGRHRGDWWEVSAQVGGQRRSGWASSLWLRRADEAGSRFVQAHRVEVQALDALGRAAPGEAEGLVDRHREVR